MLMFSGLGQAPAFYTSAQAAQNAQTGAANTDATGSTGYSCTPQATCQGFGDTATLFANLQTLINQALALAPSGQTPPAQVVVNGTIDYTDASAIQWLHENTTPPLFPELDSGASGDYEWVADNAADLVQELQAFVGQAALATNTSQATASIPVCPAGSTWDPTSQECLASAAPICPVGSTWDPTSGACAAASAPNAPAATWTGRLRMSPALLLGGIAAIAIVAVAAIALTGRHRAAA